MWLISVYAHNHTFRSLSSNVYGESMLLALVDTLVGVSKIMTRSSFVLAGCILERPHCWTNFPWHVSNLHQTVTCCSSQYHAATMRHRFMPPDYQARDAFCSSMHSARQILGTWRLHLCHVEHGQSPLSGVLSAFAMVRLRSSELRWEKIVDSAHDR